MPDVADPAPAAGPPTIERVFRFVLRHRVGVVVACAVLTAASLGIASRLVVASSLGDLFLDEVPEFASYLDWSRRFGNDETFAIAYEHPSPLDPDVVRRLRDVVDRIEAHPEVARVHSLLDAVAIRGDGEAVRVDRYVDVARTTSPGEALDRLRADPRYRGTWISTDGRASCVVVELVVDPRRPAETGPAMVDEILGLFEEAGFPRETLHRAGYLAVLAEVMRVTRESVTGTFPLCALALTVVVWLLFRRLAPALMAVGVAAISVCWTLGFNALLTREFSVFASMVPSIVLTVALSDIVHLWSAYLLELRRGLAKEEAILAVSREVGSACLLTSITTFTGFVSLSAVPTPAFRELGVVLGFGVGSALLLAVTLVPVALSWMKTPRPESVERVHHTLDRLLGRIARVSGRHPRAVVIAFAIGMVPIAIGLGRFEMEADFGARFDPESSIRMDERFFEERFAGTATLELMVDAVGPGHLLDGDRVHRLAAYEEAVEAIPDVDEVISPLGVVRSLHEAIAGPGEPLPTTPGAIAQYLLLVETAGTEMTEWLERFLGFDRRTVRMVVRLGDDGFRAAGRIGERAEELASTLGPGTRVQATGLAYLLGSSFDRILEGQRRGLLLSFVGIATLMALGLRSVRIGLWSMVPNLLPLLALVAFAGLRWGQVDTDILVVALMAIGIGVDDTIHFLVRYRIESRRGPDTDEARARALETTFAFAGRGIVMTTLILCAGFLPFVRSDYFSAWILGAGLPGVLLVALLADLFLVPAMARLGWLRFTR